MNRSRKTDRTELNWRHTVRHRSIVVVVLATVALLIAADAPETAVQKVRQGLEYFRNAAYSDASTAFSEAAAIAPENATITFDKACAALADGDADQARSLFLNAAAAKDSLLSVSSHYNLGCLEADQAREKLGEDPFAATGELRDETISLLLASVRHYRDVLRMDRNHKAARHNLELIRLYIKHLQSKWEERDRQKDREEKNLLQFLKLIEERQTQIRTISNDLRQEDSSVQQRQFVAETTNSQRKLREEIEPLKEKIRQELQSAAQSAGTPGATASNGAANAPDSQQQQAEQLLLKMSDDIGQQMLKAADTMEKHDLDSANLNQTKALSLLNQLYMALAPYQDILQRSLAQQQLLAPPEEEEMTIDSAAAADPGKVTDTSTSEASKNEAEAESAVATSDGEGNDLKQVAEQQSRISDWSQILPLKAEQALPTMKQQLESLQQSMPPAPADDDTPTPENSATDDVAAETNKEDKPELSDEEKAALAQQEQLQQQVRQLEGLVKSMELAIERASDAEEHSRTAEQHLATNDANAAAPEQQQTLKILKEIAEPLQQDKNDQNQQDKENEDKDQQQKDEQDQDKQNPDKNDPQQDKPPEENQDDSQKQQDQKEQQKEQQKEAGQRQAESVLRDAREREQKYRELQKMLRVPIKVERDW